MIANDGKKTSNLNRKQQQIYDHLIYCVKTESTVKVLERFNHLFIKATGYQDNRIRIALENIIESSADTEFPLFFNRCCHIIVNRWQMQPNHKVEIIELVLLLERALPPGGAVSRIARKQRQLINDFLDTEYFVKLQRLARLIDGVNPRYAERYPLRRFAACNAPFGSLEPENRRHNRIEIVSNSVGDLIQRYPYLHQHCLLTEASTEEFQQTVENIQAKIQSDYELNLSQYITYRVRLARLVKKYKAANKTKISKKLIQKVENPTLLSDRDLNRALRHYMGKVDRNNTYYDLSRQFLIHTTQTGSYKEFKADLYEYIIAGIDSRFGKRRFNDKLYNCLQNTMVEFEDRELNEFLTMRTYCQLFKFLVVDGKGNYNHERYIDLITYLGEVRTIGLLLKLVLLCSKVKPYLEQRFSLLFSYYEAVSEEQASWLIKSLENLQIAFSVHFGKADFSLIQIV